MLTTPGARYLYRRMLWLLCGPILPRRCLRYPPPRSRYGQPIGSKINDVPSPRRRLQCGWGRGRGAEAATDPPRPFFPRRARARLKISNTPPYGIIIINNILCKHNVTDECTRDENTAQ